MTGQEKFDTCSFRSENEETVVTTGCCGFIAKSGYLCFKHMFEDVQPHLCEPCVYYKPRVVEQKDAA